MGGYCYRYGALFQHSIGLLTLLGNHAQAGAAGGSSPGNRLLITDGSEFLGMRNEVKQLGDQITQLENHIAQLQQTGGS